MREKQYFGANVANSDVTSHAITSLLLPQKTNKKGFCFVLNRPELNTPPFGSGQVGGLRHPALRVGGGHQVALALQQVLVLGVVSQPAEQGLAGVVPHAGVGQAHRQGHEGREVVGVELQTPGRRQGSRVSKHQREIRI